MFSAYTLALLSTVTVHAPKAQLQLEVAQTAEQRSHGLMDRRSLTAHTGMLFVFAADAPVAFWMKDTLIPLDMVFVAPDGTVRTVYAGVAPAAATLTDDAIPREPGVAKYVIELNGGEARADGIVPGVRLTIPALPRA